MLLPYSFIMVYANTKPLNGVFRAEALSECSSTKASNPSGISASLEGSLEDCQNISVFVSEKMPLL